MKALHIALICCLSSALGGAGVHFLASTGGGEATLNSGNDDALFNASRRMVELEEKLDAFQRKLDPVNRRLDDAETLFALQPEKIRALEQDLAALRGQLATGGGAQAQGQVRLVTDEGEEIMASASDLESFIAMRVDEKVKTQAKRARREQYKQWEPFARMGMMRGLDRNAQRLGLNEEQTRRLRDRTQKSFETIMPRFGVLMDPEATPEERAEAVAAVQAEVEVAGADAESYMTPEQYGQYQEMQSQQSQQMMQWLEALGGANGAGPGTGPGTGGNSLGGFLPPSTPSPGGN